MFTLKIAIRNLTRNKERTLLSLMMLASAVCALILFRTYTDQTFYDLEKISTEMQFGHLQVAKENYWKNTFTERKQSLMPSLNDLEKFEFHDIIK